MTKSIPKSAEEDPGTNSKCPPVWAESILRHVLQPRDRESIPGDLLEEYREERLSKLGHTRANLWYIRQILSLAFFKAWQEGPMKRSLICLCFLTLASSAWLGFMVTTLHRPWPLFEMLIIWAVELAAVSLTTILYLMLPGYRLLRKLLSLGAVPMLSLGIILIAAVIGSAPFEVFILLFGAAGILQLALAILTLAFVPDIPDSRIHLFQ